MMRSAFHGEVALWPLKLRRMMDGIATVLMQAFMLARERALGSPSSVVQGLAERDGAAWESAIRDRELALFQRRIEAVPPHKRPHVPPGDRFEILPLMRLRGLSVEKAARRYVIHPNTLRDWMKRFETDRDVKGFFGPAPFNKIHDALRWLVHKIRALSPEKEFGTLSIAMRIARAGIQISRSSVQRILRKKKPERPAPVATVFTPPAPSTLPHGILRPKERNRAWHLDLATFDFLWTRFYVAAIVDGFSRKLLALRVYRDAPTTRNMIALVRRSVREFGTPRFLVTDYGCQFRTRFKQALSTLGTAIVKGRVSSCAMNGKVERFFRTLRIWQRVTLFACKIPWIEKRLDIVNAGGPFGGSVTLKVRAQIPLVRSHLRREGSARSWSHGPATRRDSRRFVFGRWSLCDGRRRGIVDSLADGSAETFLNPEPDHLLVPQPMLTCDFPSEFEEILVYAKRNEPFAAACGRISVGLQRVSWALRQAACALLEPVLHGAVVVSTLLRHRRGQGWVFRHVDSTKIRNEIRSVYTLPESTLQEILEVAPRRHDFTSSPDGTTGQLQKGTTGVDSDVRSERRNNSRSLKIKPSCRNLARRCSLFSQSVSGIFSEINATGEVHL